MKKVYLMSALVVLFLILQSGDVRAYCRSPSFPVAGLFHCPEEENIYSDVAWRTTNDEITIYGIVDFYSSIYSPDSTGAYKIGGIEVKDAASGTLIASKTFDPPIEGNGITFVEITVPKSSFKLDSNGVEKVNVELINFRYQIKENIATGSDFWRLIARFIAGKKPLEIKFAKEPLPKSNSGNWFIGDVHYHTKYSENPAEFGAPLDLVKKNAKEIGLDWITITDHSFALKEDQWPTLVKESKDQSDSSFIFTPGEEVSCETGLKITRYNHYLAHGLKEYVPGGEIEANLGIPSSCSDSVNNVNKQGSFGYAAHPYYEDRLFNIIPTYGTFRAIWQDYELPFTGLQIWNYDSGRSDFSEDSEISKGLKQWESLINHRQVYISAGSDAHGDFNSLMGKARTYVYSPMGLTQDGILGGLKHGSSFITNGPFLSFEIETNKLGQKIIKEKPYRPTLNIEWLSTEEFGSIKTVKIIKNSQVVKIFAPNNLVGAESWADDELTNSGLTYYRLEAETVSGYRAYTNPIWITTTRGAKTISALLENTGTKNATNVTVGFYDEGGLIGNQTIDLIENQTSIPISIGWNPVGGGKRKITVKADNKDIISELSEEDNTAYVTYEIETDRIVGRSRDKILPAQTKSYGFFIDKITMSAGFFLKWPGSDLNLTLETPSGLKIDSSSPEFLNYVEFSSVPSEKAFRIKNPEAGEWKAYITAVDVPEDGEEFEIVGIVATTLTADISTDKPNYKQNSTIQFFVNVSENSLPNLGASVTLEIGNPAKVKRNITLLDDGALSDNKANDGIYSASYSGTEFSGFYNLTAYVTGRTSKGDQFVRLQAGEVLVIEGTPPSVKFITPENGKPTNLTPVFFATFDDGIDGSGIDKESVHLFIDNVDARNSSLITERLIRYATTLTAGAHAALIEVKDRSGNSASDTVTFVVRDDTPPLSSLSISGTPGNNGWYINDVSATISATDNSGEISKIEYSFDNATFSIYTKAITISQEGITNLYFRATDKSGNVEETKSAEIKIDKSAPTILSTTPTEGQYVNLTPEIKVTFSDPISGLDLSKLAVFLDGTPYEGPITFILNGFKILTLLTPGPHILNFKLPDLSGNWVTGALTFASVKPTDVVAPVSTLALTGNEGKEKWFRSDVTATLTATDIGTGIDRIEYSFDGANFQKYTTPLKFSNEGIASLYYHAIDKAGNIENTKVSAPFIIDKFADGQKEKSLTLSGSVFTSGSYEGDVLPTQADPKWIEVGPANNRLNSANNGILKIVDPDQFAFSAYRINLNISNKTDFAIEARVKIESLFDNSQYGVNLWWYDGVKREALVFFTDRVAFYESGGLAGPSGGTVCCKALYYMNTTDGFHVYRLEVKQPGLTTLYVDGVRVLETNTARPQSAPGGIIFGDVATDYERSVSYWDYVRWSPLPKEGVVETAYVNIPKTAVVTDTKLTVEPVLTGGSGVPSKLGWYEADDVPTKDPPADPQEAARSAPATTDKWTWVGTGTFVPNSPTQGILRYYGFGHSYLVLAVPELNNSKGTTMETRVRILQGSVNRFGNPQQIAISGAFLQIDDGTRRAQLWVTTNEVWLSDTCYNNLIYRDIDTTSDFHAYTLKLKGQNMEVYVDGKLLLASPVTTCWDEAWKMPKRLYWGISSSSYASFAEVYWDYVRYNAGNTIVPSDIALDVGADGTIEWSKPGIFLAKTLTTNLTSGVEKSMKSCTTDSCSVPLRFTSGSPGTINAANLYIYVEQTSTQGVLNKTDIKIDKTIPQSTAKIIEGTLGENNWYNDKVKVQISGTDGISGVDKVLYNPNSSETFYAYNSNLTISEEGNVTLYYYAQDKAGNIEDTHALEVRIDRTPPKTTSNAPLDWIRNGANITLNATDSVSSVRETLYCADQSNTCIPNITGGRISVNSEGINYLRFNSIDEAGNKENMSSAVVKLDSTPPVINISSPEQGRSYRANIDNLTFNYAVTDNLGNVTIVKSFDGNIFTPQPLSTTELTTLSDGVHNFTITAQDQAGNIARQIVNFTVLTDTTPPATTDNSPKVWQKSDFTVTLSATDDASGVDHTTYRVDSGAWATGTAISINTEGNHTIEYYSVDNIGNIESTKKTYAALDKTAPLTTASGVPADWANKNVTITLNAIDSLSSVSRTYYTIDNNAFVEGTSLTISNEGTHTVKYYSIDNAGNSETQKSAIVKIDKTPPTTTASGIDTNWQKSDFTAALNATDDISRVSYTTYRIDSENWINGTAISINTEGNHTIEYYSVDNAGNAETTKQTYAALDKSAADVSVVVPVSKNYSYTEGTLAIDHSATDKYSGIFKSIFMLDDVVLTLLEIDLDKISLGLHELFFSIEDFAGNLATGLVTFKNIDDVPPASTAEITSGTLGNNEWYISNAELTLSAVDEKSGVEVIEYNFDSGDSYNGYSEPLLISNEGEITLYYKAVDNAGNFEQIKPIKVKIDKSAPLTTVSGIPLAVWANKDVTITFNAADNYSGVSKTFYKVDSGEFIEGVQATISAEGEHTLTYYSQDLAGNNEAEKSAVIKIDKTAPLTSAIGIDDMWHISNIQIILNSSDSLSGVAETYYKIYQNGTPGEIKKLSADGQPIISYEDNDSWVEYWGLDKAGNEETLSLKKGIKLDKTKPIVAIYSPADGTIFSNLSFIVDFEAIDPLVQGTPSEIKEISAFLDGSAVSDNQIINSTNLIGGMHTLIVTATDNAGNIANVSSTFTLISSYWLKNNTLSKLENAKTGDEKVGKEIDKVIGHIENSLADKKGTFWIAEWHIVSKHCEDDEVDDCEGISKNGKKVFNEEKKAVKRMQKRLKDECSEDSENEEDKDGKEKECKTPESVKSVYTEVIDDLVKADEQLALAIIEDAKNTLVEDPEKQEKVNEEIEKAESELNKAYGKLADNQPDKAIDHFKKAWEHAQHAMEHAEKVED